MIPEIEPRLTVYTTSTCPTVLSLGYVYVCETIISLEKLKRKNILESFDPPGPEHKHRVQVFIFDSDSGGMKHPEKELGKELAGDGEMRTETST